MKLTKSILLTVVLSVGFIIPGCEISNPCNCPTVVPFFDVQGISTDFDAASNINNPIPFSDFRSINIWFDVDYHASNNDGLNWNFSLMNSALACSCVQDGFDGSATERLLNLEVFTINDFDENHAAGESINDLLLFHEHLEGEEIELVDFLNQPPDLLRFEYIKLMLKKRPELDNEMKLRIVMELTDEEVYEIETNTITFTP